MCPSEFIYFILTSAFTILLTTAIIIFYFLKYFTKNPQQYSSTQLPKNDLSADLKFKNELMTQLKELSQKTSAEGPDDPSVVQLQDKCAAVRGKILAHLEKDQANGVKKFKNLEKTLEEFGKESAFSRDCLERVTSDEEFYEDEMNSRLVEISIQTEGWEDEGFGEGVNDSFLEVFDNEHTNIIFHDIKSCKEQIVNESRSKWEIFILEISTFVMQHNKNIEELLNAINHENVQKIKEIMAETGHIFEKQLLEVKILVNQKSVEVQTIEETTKIFNHNFLKVVDKCATEWGHSCSSLDATRDLVCEAKDNLIFSSCKMSRITSFLNNLTMESGELTRRLENAVYTATAIVEAKVLRKPNNKRMEEVFGTIEHMKGTLAMMGEKCGLNFSTMSESLETPSQRCESFIHYVEDLVRNIADKYKDMMTCGHDVVTMWTSTSGHHGNNGRLGDLKDIEALSMISDDGISCCQQRMFNCSSVLSEISLFDDNYEDLVRNSSSDSENGEENNVRKFANNYEGMTIYPSTCGHHSNNGRLEDAKEIHTLSIISGDEMPSYPVVGCFNEFSFEVSQSKQDGNNPPKKANSKEALKHTKLRKILPVPADFLRTNTIELDKKDGKGLKEKFSSKRDIKSKLKKGMFDWSSVPSEISLFDITCDDLVLSSSPDSEKEEEYNI